MQAVVDNLLTNYQLQGKGKLVLFLHGWADNSQGSLALQKELAQSYTVLAPDLPGFGKTQAPSEGWNLDNYAQFVAALLQKLQLEQPYAIIGHSNGGAVAVRGIAMQLFKPQKLVLLASAGIRDTNSVRRLFFQILAKTGNLATIGLPERYRRSLRQQLYKRAGSDMLIVEELKDTFKKTVRQDIQHDAQTVAQPTLLIFGEHDQAVPAFAGERFKSLIQNAELHMVDAGHFVHLDQAEQTATLVKDFLG